MNDDRLERLLETRAPGAWELYRKEGSSRESWRAGRERGDSVRRESGLAARWWDPSPRFAAASNALELARAIERASEAPGVAAEAPAWPTGVEAAGAAPALEPAPEFAEELARLVAAESRGEATLSAVTLRRGGRLERIVNAKGLDVAWTSAATTGVAEAVGRRGPKSCEARALFRWEAEPDLASVARRLSDRATLPLSDRRVPIERGEWLLDASVAASLLAGLTPLFLREGPPRWAPRGAILPADFSVVDDATGDAPFDGEGTRTRRVTLVERGTFRRSLHDLGSARASKESSTGHGVRSSFRTPPFRSPRRLFFESDRPVAQRELLASVRRGIFAAALTAPLSCDVLADRYEAEFTGVSIVAGRAEGPVGAARSRGRLSELLRRIAALAPDREFLPAPYLVGGSALLIERASFG
jgi:predicted Zn-dependent protease